MKRYSIRSFMLAIAAVAIALRLVMASWEMTKYGTWWLPNNESPHDQIQETKGG